MGVTFLSINSKGLNHPVQRKSLWSEALQFKSDILCAQETHFCATAQLKCSHKSYPYVSTANAESKKRGVLTAIRDTVSFQLHKEIKDPSGRYLILICDINSTTYTIANVYTPNSHLMKFLNKQLKKIDLLRRGALVICRDFILAPDKTIDSTSTSTRKGPSLLSTLHQHRSYSRIDLFLVDQSLLSRTTNTTINTITWSDHASVTLTIKDSLSSGANPSLLQREDTRKLLETQLNA